MHRPIMSFRAPGSSVNLCRSLRANALRLALLSLASRKHIIGLGARHMHSALSSHTGRLAAASALQLGFLGLPRFRKR